MVSKFFGDFFSFDLNKKNKIKIHKNKIDIFAASKINRLLSYIFIIILLNKLPIQYYFVKISKIKI